MQIDMDRRRSLLQRMQLPLYIIFFVLVLAIMAYLYWYSRSAAEQEGTVVPVQMEVDERSIKN